MNSIINNIKKIFRYIRLFFKYIYGRIYLFFKPVKYNVMSIEESLDYILKNKCSVVRFGDGEFMYLNDKPIIYQKVDKKLQKMLMDILSGENKNDNVLVCIPGQLSTRDDLTLTSKWHWTYRIAKDHNIYNILNKDFTYGNTNISRPYIVFKNKKNCKKRFDLLKQIWDKKNIILVEGKYSRTGVGNDLFKNANLIRRIICPSEDAFSVYGKMKKSIEKAIKDKSETVVLLAAGPTAKPLIFDLAKKGIRSIDIGNIDSEYEWFIKGCKKREKINNKHTADSKDVELEDCHDEDYVNSIIEVIENNVDRK